MRHHADDAPGHDSFLDIVANIVGILIILVMVVGVRVKNAPVRAELADPIEAEDASVAEAASFGKTTAEEAAEPDPPSREKELVAQLGEAMANEHSLREDAARLEDEVKTVQAEALARYQERERLALLVSAAKQTVQQRRDELDAAAQEEFDSQQAVSAVRNELEQVQQELARLEDAPGEIIRVENYPTPLSRTVDGDEVHFQLRAGRIAHIPLKRLCELRNEDIRRRAAELRSGLRDTVGPVDGFRLRYEAQLASLSVETARGPERTAVAAHKSWTVIPVSPQVGETAAEALAPGSAFRRVLGQLDPGRDTVTIWVYPDSFPEFRRLKKELYRLGFAAAGRPLTHSHSISGSPLGSKSAAE